MPQTCYNNPFFKYFYERVRNGAFPCAKTEVHNDLSCSDALERMVQIPLQENSSTAGKLHVISGGREIACNLQWQGTGNRIWGGPQGTLRFLTRGFY
jgi:hypothetical protein